ncbi:MAG: glycerophosphodiester phosphodiesterase, partial [Byssovorax sp.]
MRRFLDSIHPRFRPLPALVLGASLVGACSGGEESPPPTPSVDAAPLILGHRGLPGLFPEET